MLANPHVIYMSVPVGSSFDFLVPSSHIIVVLRTNSPPAVSTTPPVNHTTMTMTTKMTTSMTTKATKEQLKELFGGDEEDDPHDGFTGQDRTVISEGSVYY